MVMQAKWWKGGVEDTTTLGLRRAEHKLASFWSQAKGGSDELSRAVNWPFKMLASLEV